MLRERCRGDQRPITFVGGAHDSCWPVQLGVQVLLEVGLVWETSDALGALVVHPVIMLLEFRIAVE